MTTARELLEQADALIGRNRLREAAAADAATDIPVLTEVVAAGDAEPPGTSIPETQRAAAAGADVLMPAPRPGNDALRSVAGEVPILTEIVEDIAPISIVDEPDTAAEGAPAAAAARVASDTDVARWNTLAEEVRMQVLQSIDIFTDTGLQEQLAARLQPIVDRASADLVATINQQVGQLLRGCVAEAIEREIEKRRKDGAS